MVTFRNGLTSYSSQDWAGSTVGDIFDSEAMTEILNLRGSEVVTVQRGGLNVNADRSTVLQANDTVSFSQNSGGKGLSL